MTRPAKNYFLYVAMAWLWLGLSGCDNAPGVSASGLEQVKMQVGNRSYTLEVADTNRKREKGLMERDSLANDAGMIFVFSDESPRGFWMHNTRFPLDIIFLDSHGKIVSIHTMQAYDESATRSLGPAKYAIELNANQASTAGVKIGETISIPAGVSSKE